MFIQLMQIEMDTHVKWKNSVCIFRNAETASVNVMSIGITFINNYVLALESYT